MNWLGSVQYPICTARGSYGMIANGTQNNHLQCMSACAIERIDYAR